MGYKRTCSAEHNVEILMLAIDSLDARLGETLNGASDKFGLTFISGWFVPHSNLSGRADTDIF